MLIAPVSFDYEISGAAGVMAILARGLILDEVTGLEHFADVVEVGPHAN